MEDVRITIMKSYQSIVLFLCGRKNANSFCS